tara:strand:+ start:198 stop:602 length:405 start_codon:yes stop_codon:yes gene_type:complete
MLNLDKAKQREIRNAVIVGISANASTSIWNSVQQKIPALSGPNSELFKAGAGALLLGAAPRKSGLAKDLVENIALGMVVSGVLEFSKDSVSGLVSGLLPMSGLSGYLPRTPNLTLGRPALGRAAYGTDDLSPII